ncbi:DUF5794 domain-containing protein [Halococcus thailandensis]|uniref:Uncharacterized protein n=1 Tax=Halococcus thailandensis JCM 13552 TaxID=1227457 RepID=M0N0D4_9EURY|nr:DUF5794 domain-containing protein [Halococcus thailandensis]EMA51452.1 hypothetical protein C451_14345 [Halococcus thailandensis JCM 13552]
MSHSQHPVALRLEQRVGGAARLLATVMALPLVDGIFPAMVLAGALSDPIGILEVGLLVFGGSATVAVILAEMSGSRRERVETTLAVGVVVLVLAGVEAALAPTIESLLDLVVFERFAALVILAIAAKTASARVGEYLPRPAVIVGLGMVASLDPANAQLVLVPDFTLVLRGVAAAGTGVAFALAVAVTSPWLHDAVDIDRFRFGSAVALGVLGLSVLGLVPDDAPLALAVLGVTTLLAFDPGEVDEESGEATAEETTASTTADEETDIGPDRAPWL